MYFDICKRIEKVADKKYDNFKQAMPPINHEIKSRRNGTRKMLVGGGGQGI